jgi:hypothetical protein
MVQLHSPEATVQISIFTGQSLKEVEAILGAHCLGRDIQLAEAATSIERRGRELIASG